MTAHGGLRRAHAHDLPPRARGPAAARGRARARARLPGLRDPDGPRRRRDRARRAARRDRSRPSATCCACPAAGGSLLEAKARGADVRMVYSPLDALALARREPEREVVFFAIGFETTAPATAVTLLRARASGIAELLRLLQPRARSARRCRRSSTRPGTARRRLHRPRPRLDRDRHATPYGFIAERVRPADRRRRLRAARPAPVDRHAAAPARRGPLRGREPVHARRAPRGQPAGARGDRRDDVELRDDVRVARPRHDPAQRAAARDRSSRRATPSSASAVRARARGPEGVPLRRGPARHDQAVRVRRLRHRLHAGAAARHLHGLERGRVRGVLRLRAPAGTEADGVARQAGDAARRARSTSRTAPAARRRATSSRRSSSRSCGNPLLEPLGDAALVAGEAAARVHDRLASSCSPLVFPGGDIGELAVNGTVNDLAMAGARPLSLSAGFVIEEGFPIAELRADRRVDGGGGATPPASRSSPATRRSSSAARPTASTSRPPASASLARGVELGPRASAPATACSSPARSATTAWP